MNNPKDCIHCYDYEDMGCKMPVCEFDFPSINTPKCNNCSKFIKRDLVQVVRCKDCKHKENLQKGTFGDILGYDGKCNIVGMFIRDNCYCAWGESGAKMKGKENADG